MSGYTSYVVRRSFLAALILGAVVSVGEAVAQDVPPKSTSEPEKQQSESLDVRYARAHLKIANLDLRRALVEYERRPDVISMTAIERLRKHVAIDEEQLKQTLKSPDGNLHAIYLRSAKIAVDMATADHERKKARYETHPNEYTKMDVERAAAMIDLTKIQLEVTQSKTSSLSSLMYLQWQIEVLRNQVLELQMVMGNQR